MDTRTREQTRAAARGAIRRAEILTFVLLTLGCPLAAASEQSPKQVVISGRVEDGDGRAFREAEVSLASVMDDYEAYVFWQGTRMWRHPVVTAETDEDGRYAFAAAAGRLWRVIVEHPGRITVTRRVEPLFEDRELTVAKLLSSRPLAITVRETGGQAVAGARVTAHTLSPPPDIWPVSWVAGATDGLGRTRVSVPPIGPWRVEVVAPGFVPVLVEQEKSSIDVELTRGSRVRLSLRLPSGRPAAGAMVYLPLTGIVHARADARGRAMLRGKPGSSQTIRILTADGAALETEVDFPIRRRRAARLALELVAPTELEVRALTANTLLPVAHAIAWGRDDHPFPGDEDGRLLLRVPATETSLALSLAAPSHVLWRDSRLVVPSAPEPAMIVDLEPSAGLGGRVIDRDGRPLANVEIEVVPDGTSLDSDRFRSFRKGRAGRSEVDGQFSLGVLPSAVRLALMARKSGFGPVRVDVGVLAPYEERRGYEVVLAEGRKAVGKVVDEALRPLSGASIMLCLRPRAADDPCYRDPGAGSDIAVRTDRYGRFEIGDLAAAVYDLRVSAAGFATAEVPGLEVEDEVKPADFGRLVLHRGLRISGQVVDEDGRPVADADVRLGEPGETTRESGPEAWRRTSDADGWFEFVDLGAGSYQVRARSEGFWVAESGRIEAPSVAPLVLVLRRGATLEGRIVDEDGDPISGARILSRRSSTGFRPPETISDESGRFELVGLRPAKHRISVRAKGFQPRNLPLQVLADVDPETLEVVLEAGVTVSGKLSRANGRPAEGVSVEVVPVDPESSHSPSGLSSSTGHFEIEAVPIGRAEVIARLGSAESSELIDVGLEGGQVSLTLDSGVEMSGLVTADGGEPVAAAEVMLRPTRWPAKEVSVFSRVDGRFTVTDVLPGKYRLRIRHPSYAPHSSKVEVSEAIVFLEARLRRGATVSGRLDTIAETLAAVRVALSGKRSPEPVAPDSQGRFRFEHVLPGEYRAEAKMGEELLAVGELELVDGQEVAEIELSPVPDIELRGRVVRSGLGVPGAKVTISTRNGNSVASYTTTDGAFVLKGIDEGAKSLRVRADGGAVHNREIDIHEGREVVIQLPSGEVGGRVLDAGTGEPMPGVTITLAPFESMGSLAGGGDDHRRTHREVTDAMGVFVLRELDRGRYRLSSKHDGYAWHVTEVGIGAEPLRDVDLELRPSDGLVLRVSKGALPYARLIRVALVDRAERLMMHSYLPIGDDRTVQVPHDPDAGWRVWACTDLSAWVELDLRSPREEIPVVLTRGAWVEFSVPELGRDLEGVVVELRDSRGRLLPGLAGALEGLLVVEGTGYVGHLWPDRWTLDVEHPDGRSWHAVFIARPGAVSSLELRKSSDRDPRSTVASLGSPRSASPSNERGHDAAIGSRRWP